MRQLGRRVSRCRVAEDAIEVTVPVDGLAAFIALQVNGQIHALIAEHARHGNSLPKGDSYDIRYQKPRLSNIALAHIRL
jgi:hypothetical protein